MGKRISCRRLRPTIRSLGFGRFARVIFRAATPCLLPAWATIGSVRSIEWVYNILRLRSPHTAGAFGMCDSGVQIMHKRSAAAAEAAEYGVFWALCAAENVIN